MITVKEYKENPCGAFSIPYWKAKDMVVPDNIRIIHNNKFDEALLKDFNVKKYFRLFHNLKNIPDFNVSGIEIKIISLNQIKELTELINVSYTHTDVYVSTDYIKSLTDTNVYCPKLWLGAFSSDKLIGSIICDYDKEIGEGIIEWLQVLPEYRGKGIASVLTIKALNKMSEFAEFATVSGECDNITNPEKVYRKCGFVGNDIWYVLSSKRG